MVVGRHAHPLIPTIALRPGDFRFNADWSSLAAVAVVVVVFLIWQTSAEELFLPRLPDAVVRQEEVA